MAKKVTKKKKEKVDPYLKAIGDKIVALRNAKGISQIELARRLNTFNNTIRRIENGTTNPTINTLRDIAAVLDIAVFDLIKITKD